VINRKDVHMPSARKNSNANTRIRVLRTGDRDLVFAGRELGHGAWSHSGTDYESHIYQTESNKFVASRWVTSGFPPTTHYTASVCESPEAVAQHFYVPGNPVKTSTRKGATLNEGPSILCEDGKLALEDAAKKLGEFTELYVEQID
jgi:hypothetical protein